MFVEISSSLIVTVAICIILIKMLSGKLNRIVSAVCAGVLLLLLILQENLIYPLYADVIISVLLAFFPIIVPVFAIKQITKVEGFYLSFFVLGLNTALVAAVHCLISILHGREYPKQLVDAIANIIFLTACILVAKKSMLSMFFGIMRISIKMKVLFLISVWFCAWSAGLFTELFQAYFELPRIALTGILIMMLIGLVCILCPLLITNNLSRMYYKNLTSVMEKQVQAQAEHYQSMTRLYADIRQYRHDAENLRIGMISLLEQNDVTSALNYLKADSILLRNRVENLETGNAIADALFYEKQARAKEINAVITFEGLIPGNLLMPADLCIIFGNALDNALEACEKCPSGVFKIIAVRSTFTNGFLFIKIVNPTNEDVRIVNNMIATTKDDKKAHGIGIQSMWTSIRNYFGDMKMSCKHNIFCLEINFDFNERLESQEVV